MTKTEIHLQLMLLLKDAIEHNPWFYFCNEMPEVVMRFRQMHPDVYERSSCYLTAITHHPSNLFADCGLEAKFLQMGGDTTDYVWTILGTNRHLLMHYKRTALDQTISSLQQKVDNDTKSINP